MKDRPDDLAGNISRLVPTDKTSDRFLQVARLRPLRPEKCAYAGIPLNVGRLREQELQDTFDCKIIDFVFADQNEREIFEQVYYDWKCSWRSHRKQAEGAATMAPRTPGHRKQNSGRGGVGNARLKPTAGPSTGMSSSATSTHSKENGKAKMFENSAEPGYGKGELNPAPFRWA